MTPLSSNTVTMMANNILNNIGDSETVNKESLVDRFVKEASFFEHAVIREQIFRLYSLKLQVKGELD